jgi:hypothetical protein
MGWPRLRRYSAAVSPPPITIAGATAAWAGDQLTRLEVPGLPGAPPLVVHGERRGHPLFGAAHALSVGGRPLTSMGAIEWHAPTTIPPIEHPGRLPPLAGTALLNVIATLAQAAGVRALRYAGPYPTEDLWRSLATCFSCDATLDAFATDALARALAADMTPVPIDFAPAPYVRTWRTPRLATEQRPDAPRPERVIIDGASYARDPSAVRRLVDGPDGGSVAQVWLGDALWATRAELDARGALRAGPHDVPAATGAPLGAALPPALCAVLGEAIAATRAAPLTPAIHEVMATVPVRWADTGDAAARDLGDALGVHVVLWQRLAPQGLARVAGALVEALAPAVARRAQAMMLALHD